MANEKRLIDANAIPWEEHYVPDGDVQWEYKKELCVLKPVIDAMPTVDAVEVVHGKWVEKIKDERFGEEWDEIALYECSACKSEFVEGMGTWCYCPNCGAKMDGDGNV